MTTASGISRIRTFRSGAGVQGSLRWRMSRGGREAASASMSRWAVTCPAHAPIMWPPTTAASWSVQTRPGGNHEAPGWKNAVPNRSEPCWSGSETAITIRCPSISSYVR